MNASEANRLESLDATMGLFDELGARLAELGVNLSVWDVKGNKVMPLEPTCEFCQVVYRAEGRCERRCGDVARRVPAKNAPRADHGDIGCCVAAVPLRQRRRLLAVVVACCPTKEMLDEESLSRFCDRLKLDRKVVGKIAEQSVRHSADQLDDLLRVLTWLLESSQGQAVATHEIENFSANLATAYEELSLLYRISGSMRVTQKPGEFLQQVCNELLAVMSVETTVAQVYAHPPATEDDLFVLAGKRALNDEQIRSLMALEIDPKFTEDNQPLLYNNFSGSGSQGAGSVIDNLIAVPLVSDADRIGMLVGWNKTEGDFDSFDLKLIGAISSQVAVFLSNHRLYADLQDLLMGLLHALTATIDAKDPYTCGHSQRVALISKRLAEQCGLGPEKVHQIYLTGLLHDIGKIGVPEAILRKKGKLTEQEYEDMKRHPLLGANILGGIRQLDEIIPGILSHHEWPNGKGYPYGLKGDEIPIEGKIICLADCFDAMSSVRTYREALPLPAAIEEIRRCAGTQFDPELVERFLEIDLEEFMKEIHQPARTVFPFALQQEAKR